MPDTRFFESLGPIALGAMAKAVGASLGDDAPLDRPVLLAAPLAHAAADAVAFLGDRRYVAALRETNAGACFVSPEQAAIVPATCVALVTPEPQAAYARAVELLHRARRHPSNTPAIHPEAQIEDGVLLSPGVVIGPGARIGAGTQIGANTVIGPGVAIGRHCRVGANATIGFALIGDGVRIMSGAVVGEAGFGVAASSGGAVDVPQLGRVVIQDGVTIGANTCIDRGAWDDTVIGERTKIDNLVQVAHNVRLGRSCVLAAQTGLSGSTVVGDGAMFGGRAGVADHLTIGSGARIAAAAGVMKDVPAGEIWCGTPARPLRRFMRETAWLAKQAEGRVDTRRGGDEKND